MHRQNQFPLKERCYRSWQKKWRSGTLKVSETNKMARKYTYQELSCVWNQRKQGNTKELFIYVHILQDRIDCVDQNLCNNSIRHCRRKKDDS